MRIRSVLVWIAGFSVGASSVLCAQPASLPIARMEGAVQGRTRVTTTPVPWAALSATQRRLLAPLEAQWSRFAPDRQRRLAQRAGRWSTLPSVRQQRIEARLAAWVHMTPAQRKAYRQNARAFRALPKAERADIRAAYIHFQSASPAQRKALRRRWRELTPAQRLRWASSHHVLTGDTAAPATGIHQ